LIFFIILFLNNFMVGQRLAIIASGSVLSTLRLLARTALGVRSRGCRITVLLWRCEAACEHPNSSLVSVFSADSNFACFSHLLELLVCEEALLLLWANDCLWVSNSTMLSFHRLGIVW